MKKTLQNLSIVSVGLLTPVFAFAQAGVLGFLGQIQNIIGAVVPILIGLALLAFMWGIILYLFKGDKEQGKTIMIGGIIALFVMTSIWGLVSILRGTIIAPGSNVLQGQDIPKPPTFEVVAPTSNNKKNQN